MISKLMILGLLAATPALAQEPTEEAKKAALMKAYHANGDSMVHWGAIDVDNEPTVVRTIPIVPTPAAPAPKPAVVTITPDPEPVPSDVCSRHHLRKVVTGSSWRCRK